MDFGFVDNSPVNESERAEVADKYMRFVEDVLKDVEEENKDSGFYSVSEKTLRVYDDGNLLTITRDKIKTADPVTKEPTAFSTYEVSMSTTTLSDDQSSEDHREAYRYADNKSYGEYVERTSSHSISTPEKTKDERENHEVGNQEIDKMAEFVKRFIESHK